VKAITSLVENNREDILRGGLEAETARRLPAGLVDWMLDAQLFAILQPAQYGGLDLPMVAALDILEAVSAIDGSVGWCLLKGSTSNQLAAYVAETGARAIWADPRIVVAGSFNPKGRALRVDGGYRLTGRWDWGTGTTHSAWIMGGAMVVTGDGIPLPAPHGGPTIKTLFVPRTDVALTDTWDTHGMRGTGSVDFAVDDVFVPEERTIDGPMSRPVIATANTAVPLVAQVMVPHAAVAIGIARGCLAAFVDLAQNKTPLMASGKLAEQPLTHDGVGRARALIDSSRAYVRATVAEAWAPDATPATYPALSLSATQATHACAEAVDILYRLAGGSAVSAASPIARRWRDIHVAASHFLVNHEKFAAAGKAMLA